MSHPKDEVDARDIKKVEDNKEHMVALQGINCTSCAGGGMVGVGALYNFPKCFFIGAEKIQ